MPRPWAPFTKCSRIFQIAISGPHVENRLLPAANNRFRFSRRISTGISLAMPHLYPGTDGEVQMAEDALSTEARWHAVVKYRADAGLVNVHMLLTEMGDIQERIEQGPHWDVVEIIEIRRTNHTGSEKLTLEQAENLG